MKYSENDFLPYIRKVLTVLGFEPRYFNVFFDEFTKMKHDLNYDKEYILKLLERKIKPESFMLKDAMYDVDDPNNWFRLRLNIEYDKQTIGYTYSFEWSYNGKLDFIMNSNLFKDLITDENFIYCFCYNQTDAGNQTSTMYNKYEDKPIDKNIKIILNEYGDKVIDVSQNWGRHESVKSIHFIAAPVMFFGKAYDTVCSSQQLLKFKYARPYTELNSNVIAILLFDLYDDPSKTENRAKQKEYWDFLKANRLMEIYKKDNDYDVIELLREKAKRKVKWK